mgnify:CR=1 FL=1
MQLNPSEISSLIKERIAGFTAAPESGSEGVVVSIADGIVLIPVLSDFIYVEMLQFNDNVFGMALNLERDSVGVVDLGDYTNIAEG